MERQIVKMLRDLAKSSKKKFFDGFYLIASDGNNTVVDSFWMSKADALKRLKKLPGYKIYPAKNQFIPYIRLNMKGYMFAHKIDAIDPEKYVGDYYESVDIKNLQEALQMETAADELSNMAMSNKRKFYDGFFLISDDGNIVDSFWISKSDALKRKQEVPDFQIRPAKNQFIPYLNNKKGYVYSDGKDYQESVNLKLADVARKLKEKLQTETGRGDSFAADQLYAKLEELKCFNVDYIEKEYGDHPEDFLDDLEDISEGLWEFIKSLDL